MRQFYTLPAFKKVLRLTLSYTGGGGWFPPLLTLVLNSVSGIQAIVLMFGDFS